MHTSFSISPFIPCILSPNQGKALNLDSNISNFARLLQKLGPFLIVPRQSHLSKLDVRVKGRPWPSDRNQMVAVLQCIVDYDFHRSLSIKDMLRDRERVTRLSYFAFVMHLKGRCNACYGHIGATSFLRDHLNATCFKRFICWAPTQA